MNDKMTDANKGKARVLQRAWWLLWESIVIRADAYFFWLAPSQSFSWCRCFGLSTNPVRSGAITRDELAQVMAKFGHDTTDRKLDALMLEADSSGKERDDYKTVVGSVSCLNSFWVYGKTFLSNSKRAIIDKSSYIVGYFIEFHVFSHLLYAQGMEKSILVNSAR